MTNYARSRTQVNHYGSFHEAERCAEQYQRQKLLEAKQQSLSPPEDIRKGWYKKQEVDPPRLRPNLKSFHKNSEMLIR